MGTLTHSPSARWLTDVYRGESPSLILTTLTRDLLRDSGQIDPPFDVYRAAQLRRVKKIVNLPLSNDAVLLPVEGGFEIKLNIDDPNVRRRFSCAHEIAHTFFFDITESKPRRRYVRLGVDKQEEQLCQQAAADLLMPQEVFSAAVKSIGPASLESMQTLGALFEVSLEALVKRIVKFGLWNVVVVGWKFMSDARLQCDDPQPPRPDTVDRCRIAWLAKPPAVNTGIRSNGTDVDLESTLGFHLGSTARSKGIVKLNLGRLRGYFWTESASFPTTHTDAISMIRLDSCAETQELKELSFAQARLF